MDEFPNPICLSRSAATMAACLGIDPPAKAEKGISWFSDLLVRKMGGVAERSLFFHPDAAAQWLWHKYPSYFVPVLALAPLALPLGVVMPSVTPVCFSTMYTGAMPAVHGIQKYCKPIMTTDTLFDRLLASGRRCANIASEGSSMAMLFADRRMDNFTTEDDRDTYEKALDLLSADRYDHISVYFGEYDSYMHKYGTEHPLALAKLEEHFRHFDVMAKAADKLWAGKRHLITVQTDHGVHDLADGRGAHGIAAADDLNVIHFFGAYSK